MRFEDLVKLFLNSNVIVELELEGELGSVIGFMDELDEDGIVSMSCFPENILGLDLEDVIEPSEYKEFPLDQIQNITLFRSNFDQVWLHQCLNALEKKDPS